MESVFNPCRVVLLGVLLSVIGLDTTSLGQTVQPDTIHRQLGDSAQSNLPTTPESIVLIDLINDFQADDRAISSFYSMGFDPASLDRREQIFHSYQNKLDSIDFDKLDEQGRIDWLLMKTHLQAQLDSLTLSRQRLHDMDALIPFASTVIELENNRLAVKDMDESQVAKQLDDLAQTVEALQHRVVKATPKTSDKTEAENNVLDQASDDQEGTTADSADGPIAITPVIAKRAARTVRQIRRVLDHWYDAYDQYEPGFAWWMDKPHERASKALDAYAKHLSRTIAGIKGDDDDPLVGDPIGREQLLADLQTEWIPYSPEELIDIANTQFAWCESEMVDASREMGYGDDWHKALEAVKNDYVQPGEQDDLVASIARRSIAYLDAHDLVTVPALAREVWRIEMISPQTQKTLPFAFYGGNYVGVAFAAQSMDNEAKRMSMRGNNRHFAMSVVPHELIPGHHLQGFVAKRERPYRSLFRTPFLVEGWALYWEMYLYDHDWVTTPEDRIGMLFWRMHRCARIIVSLKFHLGDMTPEEMIDFLVERVGHERSGATSEVRRFIGDDYSPLYQCAYMLGGLQLRSLHRHLVDEGSMSERAFHDTVLRYNAIPIELIRAGMNGQPLSRDTKTTWRFGDDR